MELQVLLFQLRLVVNGSGVQKDGVGVTTADCGWLSFDTRCTGILLKVESLSCARADDQLKLKRPETLCFHLQLLAFSKIVKNPTPVRMS